VPERVGLLADATLPNRFADRPAREAFGGTLFRLRREYATRFLDRWYVLSADCGLLAPDECYRPPAEPRCVVRGGAAFRRVWAQEVLARLRPRLPAGSEVVFLAGLPYSVQLAGPLRAAGHPVTRPAAGLSMGGQLAWLVARLEAGAPPAQGARPPAQAT